MSSVNIREAITTLFRDEFGAAYPTVRVDYDNQKFEQPTGAPWVKLVIIDGDDIRENIGNEMQFKTIGVVNCQIMVPEKTGTEQMRGMKNAIAAIFLDRKVPMVDGRITFLGEGEFRPPREVAGWYSRSYQVGFIARWKLVR